MKYLITLSFLFIYLFSFSQSDPYVQELDSLDEFYREIDWKFYPDSVVQVSDSTYSMIAIPYDYNDPGAIPRRVGNYVRDFIGHTFEVIDSLTTDRTITVYDKFKTGQAPQSSQVAKCYETVMSGMGKEIGSVDYTPLEMSARWRLNGMDNERLYRHGMVYDDPFLRNVFDTTYVISGTEPTGTSYWDDENRTISVALGNGVVIQIGQEMLTRVVNKTGDTLIDGRVIGYVETFEGLPSVSYASNNERHTFFGITTEDILPDSVGLVVATIGVVNNVNTGTLSEGAIYLDSLGNLTNTRPVFPEYVYPLGACLVADADTGRIQFRSDGTNYKNSILDAFDGAIRETFDFRTFSDGTTAYGVISNPTGANNLTLMFSDGWFDFAVPDTIALTSGTSTNPQQSWIYIDKTTKGLTSSTTDFPLTEHAEVAKLALLDAASTQTYGALRNQNTNNHLKYDDNNGHIVHLGDRLRVLNAQWENGIALTISGTPTNLYVEVTSGRVWQMHKQSFEAQSMPTDDIHIVNHPTTPYATTTNLNTVTTYSNGVAWNNQWQNLVLWGVANKTGEVSHIMVNLSSEGYLTEEDAIEDRNNYASYVIPRAFRGVGFLIARITVRRSPSGYTYNPSTGYLDLRGYYPNNTAGGGTGSSGITEFTQLDDTPSSYIGQAFKFVRVDSGETALEFVDGSTILLTDLDSTGFTVDTSQVIGLDIFRDDITALQADSHVPATVTDGITIDFTLTGQDITAETIDGAIDHDALLNFTTDEHFTQGAISIPASQISDFDTEVSNNPSVTANTAKVSANDPTITIEGTAVVGSPETFTLNQAGTKTITINQSEDQTITSTDGSVTVTPSGSDYDLSVELSSGGATFLDTITQTSHGFSVGKWIAYDSTGVVIYALADTAITADVIGIVKEIIDVNTFSYQYTGIYTDGIWTEGANYFLSTTSSGDATTSQTYTQNDVYLFLGTGTESGLNVDIDVGFVIDTTVASSGGGGDLVENSIINETPTGLVNSSNVNYSTLNEFIATTTRVQLNGVRQTLGLHYSEASTTGITFEVAYTPQTNDILRIDYNISEPMMGLQIYNETPTGTINGVNDTFTASNEFTTASSQPYLNGVRQILGLHYTEGTGTIVFESGYIPQPGDILRIDYTY